MTEHQTDMLPDAIRGAAAVSGAIASMNFMPHMTVKEMVLYIPSGCGASYFLAPLVWQYVGADTEAGQAAWAFLTGLFGMTVLSVFWRAVYGRNLGELISLFRSMEGRK